MTIGTRRVFLALTLLIAGGTPAAAQHGADISIGSTANGGGALAVQYDFTPKIQLAPSITIGGTTVYTATDPGFDAILADAAGFFVLDTNTQVAVQLLAFDAGASLKVRTTVLDAVNESAVLGTYTNAAPDALHHHPTWMLTLPNGVYGDYELAFRLTTTSGAYTASQAYAVVLTNATPSPTATSSATPSATATTTSNATATALVATATPTATPTPEPVCAAAPLTGCRTPAVAGKSSLVIVDKVDDAKDTLQWKLQKGPITPKADFGDPPTTTSWAFCIYDATGALAMQAEIPAGRLCTGRPCWKTGRSFFRYVDGKRSLDGVQELKLTAGSKIGKSALALKGKGVHLDLPSPSLATAVSPLTVQLQGDNGLCFETVLVTTKIDSAGKLEAK